MLQKPEITSEKMKSRITPDMADAVKLVLLCRAHKELMLKVVRPIEEQILKDHPLYSTLRPRKNGRQPFPGGERILTFEDMYLCLDEDACMDIYKTKHDILVELGYELKEVGYCPHLIAEHEAIKAERILVDLAEGTFNVSFDQVMCSGMDKLKQYIELLIEGAVNLYPERTNTASVMAQLQQTTR